MNLLNPSSSLRFLQGDRRLPILGGFMGRKSDSAPGAKVIWRGIMALKVITQTFAIFSFKDVGKG